MASGKHYRRQREIVRGYRHLLRFQKHIYRVKTDLEKNNKEFLLLGVLSQLNGVISNLIVFYQLLYNASLIEAEKRIK